MNAIAQKIAIDIFKQVVVTFLAKSIISSNGTAKITALPKESAKLGGSISGLEISFVHNSKNNVQQETQSLENFLVVLDWKNKNILFKSWLSSLEKDTENIKTIPVDAPKLIDTAPSTTATAKVIEHPTVLVMNSIRESLDKINASYQAIEDKIEFNKNKFFSSFRTTNYQPLVDNFSRHYQLLNNRLSLFERFCK